MRYRLNQSKQTGFGNRMRGVGPEWLATKQLFELYKRKLGYENIPNDKHTSFKRPDKNQQMHLFH